MQAVPEREFPQALSLLASERPRNLGWFGASGLLFGDWGTSRLYVLGIAFFVAGRSSFMLIAAMSLLILAVGWAYTQVCRLYPDGGGVYTAARERHPWLGVLAALLLFADYTVTASLSAFEAFHYFGLGEKPAAEWVVRVDPGSDIRLDQEEAAAVAEPLFTLNSPGLWAIVSILAIGGLNLLGPKHSSGFAIFAALGMVVITLLVVGAALPQVRWDNLDLGTLNHPGMQSWRAFVSVVLALSGVEAIASMTGVMKKPVMRTAGRSIWIVAAEVAVFNILLAVVMCAAAPAREAHQEDMLAYLAGHFIGAWGEWPVRILGGLLLLSATNTAIGALIGTLYVMSRDYELPAFLQRLNGFGTPWIGAVVASAVPAAVLLFVNNLTALSHLYAIGIVGAVAINCCLCAFHPRLRKHKRKLPMLALGVLLAAIWITLAVTKLPALIFVTLIVAIGFVLRWLTRFYAAQRPKPSLLRQAISEQLSPAALSRPRWMVATAGGSQLAEPAVAAARKEEAALIVCFVREVSLNHLVESETSRFTLDNDPAAQALFIDYLAAGHKAGVPIIPAYDTSQNPAETIAELAALNGASKVIMGTSRRGTLHQFIKGSFQHKIEALLPEDVKVEIMATG